MASSLAGDGVVKVSKEPGGGRGGVDAPKGTLYPCFTTESSRPSILGARARALVLIHLNAFAISIRRVAFWNPGSMAVLNSRRHAVPAPLNVGSLGYHNLRK